MPYASISIPQHFTGQRRWSDAQLRRAVARSYSWRELLAELGLAGRNADERTRVTAHAMRLGLDLGHLQEPKAAGTAVVLTPDVKWLRDAGAAIAATWFLIRGCNASIPIEPTLYDLLVSMPEGVKRVQVKTTTYSKNGWEVQVGRRPYSEGNRGALLPYDPDALDFSSSSTATSPCISYPVGFSPGACRSSCAPTPSSSSVILMAL